MEGRKGKARAHGGKGGKGGSGQTLGLGVDGMLGALWANKQFQQEFSHAMEQVLDREFTLSKLNLCQMV